MNLQGSASMKITATGSASSRMNLGIHHLYSACKAAARIEAVENANKGQPFGEFWDEVLHDSLVVATSSVAALESYANELYFEGKFISPALNEPAASQVSDLIDKESILKKFALALALMQIHHFAGQRGQSGSIDLGRGGTLGDRRCTDDGRGGERHCRIPSGIAAGAGTAAGLTDWPAHRCYRINAAGISFHCVV